MKRSLRAAMRSQRSQDAPTIGSAQATQAARQVAALLAQAIDWAGARCVALYAGVGNELDTAPIADLARRCGATTCYPRIVQKTPPLLAFHVVRDGSELQTASFGLLEPPTTAARTGHIDLFVIPGLAFDRAGRRLGLGRGFYDAALRAHPEALRVAVGHPFQLVPEVPTEAHDEPVDLVATSTGCLRTSARGQHPLVRQALPVAQATTEDVS